MKEIADRLEHVFSEEKEENTSKNILEDLESTDGPGDRTKEVIGATLEELKDSLSGNEDKKSFVLSILKIISILVKNNTSGLTKLKKIIKKAAEAAINLWPGKKQQ